MPAVISNDMKLKLVKLGEYRLAARVLVCDIQSDIVSVKSKHMERKIAKHNRQVAKQEERIDRLSEEIPRIILERQNRKK
jgi:hypothetical protein